MLWKFTYYSGFPQSWKSVGGKYCHGKMLENWQKYKVMEIENILKKSWNFSTVYHKSCTRSSDIYRIDRFSALIWLREAFCLCSRFQIVMSDRHQTIFSTPYFQFKKRFDFLFCDEYAQMIFCVCLPGIMEKI